MYLLLLFVLVVLIVLIVYIIPITLSEPFQQKPKRETPQLGKTMMNNSYNLLRGSTGILPFKKKAKLWIVNVPLVPFTKPYRKAPRASEYKFFLYNPDYLNPPLNQGDCGSCYIFSVCSMLGDRISILTSGRILSQPSVQEILECDKRFGCDGGSPEEVCSWLETTGTLIETNKTIPYTQQDGGTIKLNPCGVSGTIGVKKDSVYTIAKYIPMKKYNKRILKENIENMKNELITNGPFFAAMAVYDDFYTYNGSKPYQPGSKAKLIGGHAIEIVGYCNKGEDPRYDTGYWICKNSWGKNWPLGSETPGYFTIGMGRNVCGIESRCESAQPWIHELNTSKRKVKLFFTSFDDYYK